MSSSFPDKSHPLSITKYRVEHLVMIYISLFTLQTLPSPLSIEEHICCWRFAHAQWLDKLVVRGLVRGPVCSLARLPERIGEGSVGALPPVQGTCEWESG